MRTGTPTEAEQNTPYAGLRVIPGRRCAVCAREVREAPGGAVCRNGHGGADELGESMDATLDDALLGGEPDVPLPRVDPYVLAGVNDWCGEPNQPAPAPVPATRAETGPMAFGDDWPGVFMRGDAARAYAMLLTDELISRAGTLERMQLRALRALLVSCCVGEDADAVQYMIPFDRAVRS